MFTGRANAAWFKKVERVRVYIAILLLLLFIDRFTSLRSWLRNFMVVKEPTYKIWAFNSINKTTKVADRQWTRLSVWPWVGALTFPASPEMSVFRPAPVGRSVGKLLWKTLANTIRLSKSKKVYHILFALSTKIAKKCSSICFSIHFGGKNSVPPLFGVPAPADKQPYIRWKFQQVPGCFVDNLFLFSIPAADQAIPQGIAMQNQHGFNEIILFYI